jgi:hypothetical protein
MAYEYGSIDLGIRNPFRIEGAVRTLAGLVIAALGLIALLEVQGLVAGGAPIRGWLSLGMGVLLIARGAADAGIGTFQMLRFFVGRAVPTSLAPNVAKSEAGRAEPEVAYSSQQIEQMLQGRKNLTFSEPADWFSRLVHTMFSQLLFLPYTYRNLALQIGRALLQTLIAFLCFGLAWFSGTTGLTTITDTPVLDWLALILAGYLFWAWWSRRGALNRMLSEKGGTVSAWKLAIWIAAAVLAPVALAFVHANVFALPDVPLPAGGYVVLITLLGIAAAAIAGVLIAARTQQTTPTVEVSEHRDNWQESIHPQEIFINFENIVMANRRYKEVPNRIYRDFDAQLVEEGSDGKGRFSGEMIQETQPEYRELPVTPRFRSLRIAGTVVGQTLRVVAAVLLFIYVPRLADIANATDAATIAAATTAAVHPILIAAILGLFGAMIANHAHAFWSEIQFESLVVYFRCQGTYTESKLSMGAGIHDSTRSENVVVRSSMTPWVIACRMLSSTFGASGTRNLEFPRYVLEMRRADDELRAIISDLRGFMRKREAVAGITNEKDLAAAARIFQVNQQTRAPLDRPTEADRIGPPPQANGDVDLT